MNLFLPDSALRRDIPFLNREIAQAQMGDFERLYPGPYSLEGFQPFPPERYGLSPLEYFQYRGNAYDPRHPERRTRLYRHIADAWAEVRDHFAEQGLPCPRMKVYVLDGRGQRIYVDSQVMEKARRLVISARAPGGIP